MLLVHRMGSGPGYRTPLGVRAQDGLWGQAAAATQALEVCTRTIRPMYAWCLATATPDSWVRIDSQRCLSLVPVLAARS